MEYELQARTSGGCTPKSDTSEEAEWNGEIQKVAERNFGEKRV